MAWRCVCLTLVVPCPLLPSAESSEILCYFLLLFIRWRCIRKAIKDHSVPFGKQYSRSLNVQKSPLSSGFLVVMPDLMAEGWWWEESCLQTSSNSDWLKWPVADMPLSTQPAESLNRSRLCFSILRLSAQATAELYQMWGWKIKSLNPAGTGAEQGTGRPAQGHVNASSAEQHCSGGLSTPKWERSPNRTVRDTVSAFFFFFFGGADD